MPIYIHVEVGACAINWITPNAMVFVALWILVFNNSRVDFQQIQKAIRQVLRGRTEKKQNQTRFGIFLPMLILFPIITQKTT